MSIEHYIVHFFITISLDRNAESILDNSDSIFQLQLLGISLASPCPHLPAEGEHVFHLGRKPRAPGNSILLEHPSVSEDHCRIVIRGKKVYGHFLTHMK